MPQAHSTMTDSSPQAARVPASPGQLSAPGLRAALERGEDLVLLDVREPHELRLAAIDGALHIPMGEIIARRGEVDPCARVVVMCHHGIRSWNVACYLLERGGFCRVDNLSGGIDAWSLHVDPTVPRY